MQLDQFLGKRTAARSLEALLPTGRVFQGYILIWSIHKSASTQPYYIQQARRISRFRGKMPKFTSDALPEALRVGGAVRTVWPEAKVKRIGGNQTYSRYLIYTPPVLGELEPVRPAEIDTATYWIRAGTLQMRDNPHLDAYLTERLNRIRRKYPARLLQRLILDWVTGHIGGAVVGGPTTYIAWCPIAARFKVERLRGFWEALVAMDPSLRRCTVNAIKAWDDPDTVKFMAYLVEASLLDRMEQSLRKTRKRGEEFQARWRSFEYEVLRAEGQFGVKLLLVRTLWRRTMGRSIGARTQT